MDTRMDSPWGIVQRLEIVSDGIVSVETSGHGGYYANATMNAQVHPSVQANDGFYEEDCHWAVLALTFRKEFLEYFQRVAGSMDTKAMEQIIIETVKKYYPDFHRLMVIEASQG